MKKLIRDIARAYVIIFLFMFPVLLIALPPIIALFTDNAYWFLLWVITLPLFILYLEKEPYL